MCSPHSAFSQRAALRPWPEAAADPGPALQEAVVAESDAAEAAAEESATAAEAAELTELEGLVGLEELERLEPPAHHPAAVESVAA